MITWTDKTKALGRDGVAWWHGGTARCPDLVIIQGPTKHNRHWRVLTRLRWKDDRAVDCPTLPEAQSRGEELVREWLDALGLQFADAN